MPLERLYCAVTPHGLGHGAIACQVINALARRRPGLDVTIQGDLPADWLASRLEVPFRLIPQGSDFGMIMDSATRVRVAASAAAYRHQAADWRRILVAEARRIRAVAPDLVLGCIPAQSLAAAQALGVPAVGLGPFHWADILDAYCGDEPGMDSLIALMREIYAGCDAFFAPQPALPMADLPNLVPVGPVCRRGRPRGPELRAALGIAHEDRLAVVAFGGMASGIDVWSWPEQPGWIYAVPRGPETPRRLPPHMVAVGDDKGCPLPDLIASADAVITKPGYGTLTEAALVGTPVLCQERPDWPETEGLLAWTARHVPLEMVSLEALGPGRVGRLLRRLMRQDAPWPRPEPPDGAEQIAEALVARYGG
ncbi:hypothetical protein [Roseospirillum parvum]|uniref:UDP:flavonoid glycosyltransferase YjiC, YdhE family n=1 Tax=Roseospirillum parvum TaxID=83401 RepID=A0A1G7YB65_9PROT|nr:hypothetical protein [Roseospirillum parvum]SDG93549.1 hypothetical protein SAMN05421742_103246 [Roseospirillum parvum]